MTKNLKTGSFILNFHFEVEKKSQKRSLMNVQKRKQHMKKKRIEREN